MARIAGVDLPREKKVEIGLTYIFGIGRATARRILATTGVSADLRVRDLNDADVNRLRQAIERDYRVEGALRTEVAMNIKRLMDIGSYRGIRHRRGLPVRDHRQEEGDQVGIWQLGKRPSASSRRKASPTSAPRSTTRRSRSRTHTATL